MEKIEFAGDHKAADQDARREQQTLARNLRISANYVRDSLLCPMAACVIAYTVPKVLGLSMAVQGSAMFVLPVAAAFVVSRRAELACRQICSAVGKPLNQVQKSLLRQYTLERGTLFSSLSGFTPYLTLLVGQMMWEEHRLPGSHLYPGASPITEFGVPLIMATLVGVTAFSFTATNVAQARNSIGRLIGPLDTDPAADEGLRYVTPPPKAFPRSNSSALTGHQR